MLIQVHAACAAVELQQTRSGLSISERIFEPDEVAGVLGVDGSTVRRYCDEFSSLLSENARTPVDDWRGLARRFTEQDMAILLDARQMLDQSRCPTYKQVYANLVQKWY